MPHLQGLPVRPRQTLVGALQGACCPLPGSVLMAQGRAVLLPTSPI